MKLEDGATGRERKAKGRLTPMRTAVMIFFVLVLGRAAVAVASPAEDLYAEGQAAYDRADYPTAIARWRASYEISGESGLLFNLAQAMRLSGDCPGALSTYRRFLATDAANQTPEQRSLADDLARELEPLCGAASASVVLADRKPTSRAVKIGGPDLSVHDTGDTRPGRTLKIAGLVTGGAGLATLATGLGLGHHGAAIGDEITAACRVSCDWAALKDKEARGKREVTIGKALDVVGVAAIAGGAIFYYLGTRQETLTIAPAPGGGGVVSWSGAW